MEHRSNICIRVMGKAKMKQMALATNNKYTHRFAIHEMCTWSSLSTWWRVLQQYYMQYVQKQLKNYIPRHLHMAGIVVVVMTVISESLTLSTTNLKERKSQ